MTETLTATKPRTTSESFTLYTARRYAESGLCVIPVKADKSKAPGQSKAPGVTEWSSWKVYESRRPTDAELKLWFTVGEGMGIVCGQVSGNLEGLDFDDSSLLAPYCELVEQSLPGLLDTLPLDDHGHLFYRCNEIEGNMKLAKSEAYLHPDGETKPDTLIETRGEGGFIIVPPTTGAYHPKGRGYTMIRGDLANIPTITADQRSVLLTEAMSFNRFIRAVREAPSVPGVNAGNRPGDRWAAATSWAKVIEPHGWKVKGSQGAITYWQRPGKDGFGCSATTGHGGHDVLYVFSSNAYPFDSEHGYSKFTAYALLDHNGDFQAATKAVVAMGYGDTKPYSAQVEPPDGEPPHYTDLGNATVLVSLYGDKLRYDYRRQRWLIWDMHRWREDYDNQIARYCVQAVRQRHRDAIEIIDKDEKKRAIGWAMSSENNNRIYALQESARALYPVAIRGDNLDAKPFLLGCNNGVIDLNTGDLRPGNPSDMVTMSINANYDENAECPRWDTFLHEVFENDEELIAFIQRAVGYSLCGDIREQCLFLCHGSGCNGKSTFLNVIRSIVGDYGDNTGFSTFELANRQNIPNDLAALVNRRLITAAETSEARRLNEARVKSVTGGDPVTCRFMRGEYFSYQPTYKVWLAMNHKPVIHGTDNGIWRRIKLIPFNVNFEATKDDALEVKLLTEKAGILAWAVQGCLQWLAGGLGTPAAVSQATNNYRTDSDIIGKFLLDKTVNIRGAETRARELYRAYTEWCNDTGERAESGTEFGLRLAERNIAKRHKMTGWMYQDIALLSVENVPVQDEIRA